MTKRLFSWLSFSIALCAILQSCRNDYLPEQSTTYDPNASKFKIVQLKDIPKIKHYLHQKTGRQDFKLPVDRNSSLGKSETGYSEIATDAIIESQKGNTTWYTFSIQNPQKEESDIVYNFQIKKVDETLESATIVAYKPSGDNPNYQKIYWAGTILYSGGESALRDGLH
jgi:hypothetical protein